MLVTIQYLGGSAKPSEVARWLKRIPNNVSMIADRMIKAGLLKRARDRKDRRVSRLTVSGKGEEALKPATQADWEFIREIFSPLSYEDRHTLASLLDTINYKVLKCRNPGVDIEGMLKDETKSPDNLMDRLVQYLSLSIPEAKRRGW